MNRWHYEFIETRGVGHQWRVGDEPDDNMMTDFATEAEAQEFVRRHNAFVPPPPFTWRY